MKFVIKKKCVNSKARTGTLTLANGDIQTPVFMPIGTVGSVKGITMEELKKIGYKIILGNTYHLWLKPGMEVMEKAGGLHKFNTWDRNILTDSGGFQAFSLSKLRKFKEEGVTFKVQSSGERKFLSPEISMQIQTTLGSNIALVLDECLPAEVTFKQAKYAMERTHRWAKRSQDEFNILKDLYKHDNDLFAIPQGAQFLDLRRESAEFLKTLNFKGYSIGGVANGGEPEEIMYSQVLSQIEILEEEKPKHLLGVGTPKDIVQMVARGIDMFDCVYPTRNARHSTIFIEVDENTYKTIHVNATKYSFDFSPINKDSIFSELQTYSIAYLCHLFKAGELLAYRLATLQNLEFYYNLMVKIRAKIEDGSFDTWWENYKQI